MNTKAKLSPAELKLGLSLATDQVNTEGPVLFVTLRIRKISATVLEIDKRI